MKGFDVLKVKSAVKTRNRFDLSRTHLTTMDFGEIVPLFVEETVPGDKFTVTADYFARLAPLVKPTYGKFSFRTVSAFVPYHQIAVDAEAWLAGKTTMEGQTPHHRYFTIGALHQFLVSYCITTTGATASNADYTYLDGSGNVVNAIFTDTGKYWVKILVALGYSLPSNVNTQTGSTWNTGVASMKLSAYPLLAFFKLYNDYMSQSQRFNSSALSDVLYRIKNGLAYTGIWSSSTGEISPGGMNALFSNIFLNYDNDYFTSAWQNPNCAINSIESISTFNVPGSNPSNSNAGKGGTSTYDSYLETNGSGSTQYVKYIGQRALDFLKSFDDWVRRNNYSGSRAVQQIYSRFGIKPDDFRAHYAHVISTDNIPVQVGDVTATAGFTDAQGTDVALGDYSGKGIMNGAKSISYSCDDFGVLFIFGYFTVVPMMAYGFDRRVLRNTPLDYYNPEFDGLGAEAISYAEIYTNPLAAGDSADSSSDDSVFGFTERYNSYRYGRDVISGEFRNYHPGGDMNVWHTGRNLNALRKGGTMIAQSSAMNTLPQSNSEYNRIFSYTAGDIDHFYMTARFKVDAVRPMLNLNQVPNLGEGDTLVPRNGNVIS